MHDILDEAMGPTRFCPKTHMPNCFPNNKWIPPMENLVANRNPIWFKMVAGSAVLMDSTTWHCGSANTSNQNRTLLSFHLLLLMRMVCLLIINYDFLILERYDSTYT